MLRSLHSSHLTRRRKVQFVSAIIYRQVKVQLMQNAPVIPLPGLWRKQEKGSDGSGGSGGGGGSRSAGNVSSTEQHRPSVVDEQAQWVQNGTGWKLTLSSGEVATDRWVQKDDHWYYLNAGGDMIAGWLLWNEHWYYLKPDGIMLRMR